MSSGVSQLDHTPFPIKPGARRMAASAAAVGAIPIVAAATAAARTFSAAFSRPTALTRGAATAGSAMVERAPLHSPRPQQRAVVVLVWEAVPAWADSRAEVPAWE